MFFCPLQWMSSHIVHFCSVVACYINTQTNHSTVFFNENVLCSETWWLLCAWMHQCTRITLDKVEFPTFSGDALWTNFLNRKILYAVSCFLWITGTTLTCCKTATSKCHDVPQIFFMSIIVLTDILIKSGGKSSLKLYGWLRAWSLHFWLLVRAFAAWEAQAMSARCSVCIQSAAVTSGEVYHSFMKNMQIVTWDYFLWQIFFLDPFRVHSSDYLPVNPCHKVQWHE